MHITICETDDQCKSTHEAGHSKLVLWGNPEGRGADGGGRGCRVGDTCTPVADSGQCMANPPQHCKVISLQLK